jgi:hypothetical protein
MHPRFFHRRYDPPLRRYFVSAGKLNFSYRLLGTFYPVFRLLLPNQVIRAKGSQVLTGTHVLIKMTPA